MLTKTKKKSLKLKIQNIEKRKKNDLEICSDHGDMVNSYPLT